MLDIDPTIYSAYNTLARLDTDEGRYDEAQRNYEKSLAIKQVLPNGVKLMQFCGRQCRLSRSNSHFLSLRTLAVGVRRLRWPGSGLRPSR